MNNFLNFKKQEKNFLDCISRLSQSDKRRILRAYEMAKDYHSNQKRDEGGPYVLHCLRVAICLIKDLGIKDCDVICAALLHDSVEDTDLKLSEIRKKFGRKVSKLVENLTKEELPEETESNKYERKYQRFSVLMKKDHHTRAIKACDWLDNMRSWSYIPKNHSARKKFPRWFKEARTMYIPLGQSVGTHLVDKMEEALERAVGQQEAY